MVGRLNFDLLGDLQRVAKVNPEVANGALELDMTE